MKLRLLAMATVAAAALSTPAMAGDGWYLGLGGGWDNQPGIRLASVPAPAVFNRKTDANDNFIGALAIGYKWAGTGWRLENELAFTQHDLSLAGAPGFTAPGATGGNRRARKKAADTRSRSSRRCGRPGRARAATIR